MKKSFFLAASMSFYRELVDIEKQLTEKGCHVFIPVSAKMMKKKNDFDVSHFKNTFTHGEKAEYIKKNFNNIAKADALLVVNGEKNGIKGYIGANVLMEIGLAFYLGKKIYILHNVDKETSYMEELEAFSVTFIDSDITKVL